MLPQPAMVRGMVICGPTHVHNLQSFTTILSFRQLKRTARKVQRLPMAAQDSLGVRAPLLDPGQPMEISSDSLDFAYITISIGVTCIPCNIVGLSASIGPGLPPSPSR